MNRRIPGFLIATAFLTVSISLSHAQSPSEDELEAAVIKASPYTIRVDDTLKEFVVSRAEAAISDHCAACHADNLEGGTGVPDLLDFDWLWGIDFTETSDVGPVMEIEQTILYGVRHRDCPELAEVSFYGACADTRFSQMPAYGDLEIFSDGELDDITQYTLSLSDSATDAAAAQRGAALWPICIECHAADGAGYKPYGGPDLTDDVWLFGSGFDMIRDVIASGREEQCPAWGRTLDAATIKSLAVYIWYRSTMIF